MSILANNLYNLSLNAMGGQGSDEQPLPHALDFSEFEPDRRETMADLVAERFGRSCHRHLDADGGDIRSLARCLEGLPQESTPETVLTFRESMVDDGGLVVIFPGQHGLARSFQRLAGLIDDGHSVLACDYDGLDESVSSAKTMDDSAEVFYKRLVTKHHSLLNRIARNNGEVVLFGYCIGGCYAHAMADRLIKEHDLEVRLVFFDGHPAEWFSGVRTRDLFRKSRKALQIVRAKGNIERRLVRQGCRQFHLLGKHESPTIDIPAMLLRSVAISESWSLSSKAWEPYVRDCREVDFPDLSHLDLIQRRQEDRISDYLQPGYRIAS
jgi:thioesterase domain-containing protein